MNDLWHRQRQVLFNKREMDGRKLLERAHGLQLGWYGSDGFTGSDAFDGSDGVVGCGGVVVPSGARSTVAQVMGLQGD